MISQRVGSNDFSIAVFLNVFVSGFSDATGSQRLIREKL
jgi:hypothetical protein